MENKHIYQPAISYLRVGRALDGGPTSSYDRAIDVLEWAEKVEAVDRGRAIRVLATLLMAYVKSGSEVPELEQDLKDGAVREIRSVLEGLPDHA
jgi:hypothetical protein